MLSFREFEQQGWEKPEVTLNYHQLISTVTTQCVNTLLDAVRAKKGCSLLDVASGAGYVAAAAIRRGAESVGIDFSSAQVSLAQQCYPEVSFMQADAENLPFSDESFDAWVCAFGMCHFPDPDRALREAFRTLKAGGRIAFSVWDQPERALGFGAMFSAIQKYGVMPRDIPSGPDFFQFSDAARCASALQDAGFALPVVRQVPQHWHLRSPDDLFNAITQGSVRAAAVVKSQTLEAQEKIRTALRGMIEAHRVDDHFQIPMPAVVASAIKP